MPSFYRSAFVFFVGGRYRRYRFSKRLDGYEVTRPDGLYLDTASSLDSARRLVDADVTMRATERRAEVAA